jgi:hypothetical protein
MILEEAIALLTLPSHPRPRLAPRSSELVQLPLHLRLAIGFSVTRISRGPLRKLCRLAWALRAPDMFAFLANGRCSRDEGGLAPVAGASDTLFGWLIDEFLSGSCPDGEHSLLPGKLRTVLLRLLLFGCSLLRVARTLGTALVLTLQTHLVGPI